MIQITQSICWRYFMKRKQILLSAMCIFLLPMSLAHAGPGKTIADEEIKSKISVRGPKSDQEIIGQPQGVIPRPFLPGFHLRGNHYTPTIAIEEALSKISARGLKSDQEVIGQPQSVIPRPSRSKYLRNTLQWETMKYPYTPTYASQMDSTPKNPKMNDIS